MEAPSLYSLIADGQYRAISLGRDKWKSLIGEDASLQLNCNKEGFNSQGYPRNSKARIGIIGNEQSNCGSTDSRIGFGTGGNPGKSITCGNVASYGPDNGNRYIKAMGYIMVQWQGNWYNKYFKNFLFLSTATNRLLKTTFVAKLFQHKVITDEKQRWEGELHKYIPHIT